MFRKLIFFSKKKKFTDESKKEKKKFVRRDIIIICNEKITSVGIKYRENWYPCIYGT